jgi:hypothetical protein
VQLFQKCLVKITLSSMKVFLSWSNTLTSIGLHLKKKSLRKPAALARFSPLYWQKQQNCGWLREFAQQGGNVVDVGVGVGVGLMSGLVAPKKAFRLAVSSIPSLKLISPQFSLRLFCGMNACFRSGFQHLLTAGLALCSQ